ncbi:hypothetical protein BaRGS_00017147 [Batillaria attramentaria]|uniref:Secreted protein n=1 Tax=Batillaria attramentaria TaxID=370345 RepID=A0ABD0KXY7_9CAEN
MITLTAYTWLSLLFHCSQVQRGTGNSVTCGLYTLCDGARMTQAANLPDSRAGVTNPHGNGKANPPHRQPYDGEHSSHRYVHSSHLFALTNRRLDLLGEWVKQQTSPVQAK